MTAIRELFEETGILLASPISHNSVPSSEKLARGRREIHSRTDPLTFPTFLQNNGLTVEESLASLIPFSQWTTPTNAKARYWTWFYVACLEEFPNILIAGDAPTKTVDGVIFGELIISLEKHPMNFEIHRYCSKEADVTYTRWSY